VPANPDALDRLKSFESKYMNVEVKVDEPAEEKTPIEPEPAQNAEPENEPNDSQQVAGSLIAEYPTSDSTAKAMEVEEKAGRVLSQKNRIVVQDAINALQALLDASETPEKEIQEEAFAMKRDMQSIVKVASYALNKWKNFEQKL